MPNPQEHVTTSREPLTPLGFKQEPNLSSAKGLPDVGLSPGGLGAIIALVQAEGEQVRWTDEGTTPTALIGTLMEAGQVIEFNGNLAALQFFEVVAGASLNVSYYKYQ